MLDIKKTASLMASEDYKDRFTAEFFQLKIRRGKLREMVERYRAKTLDFEPSCPLELLEKQLAAINTELHFNREALLERSRIEEIILWNGIVKETKEANA